MSMSKYKKSLEIYKLIHNIFLAANDYQSLERMQIRERGKRKGLSLGGRILKDSLNRVF